MKSEYAIPDDLKIGDYIKDIEDGDFWFEGTVTEIFDNHIFKYKLEKVFFMYDGYVEDDDEIGNIIYRRWSWIEKLTDITRDRKINDILNGDCK